MQFSYNTPFISFNISKQHAHTDEIYQRSSQSKSFNGKDLMVLFCWGWSRLISKLSVIRSLNLFASEARTSK